MFPGPILAPIALFSSIPFVIVPVLFVVITVVRSVVSIVVTILFGSGSCKRYYSRRRKSYAERDRYRQLL